MRHAPALLMLLPLSCASPGTKPSDMPVEEHARTAESHEAEAAKHAAQYDPNATAQRPALLERTRPSSARDIYYPPETYNPTELHRRAAASHQRLADAHAGAAAALGVYEDGACGSLPAATRAMCPLLGSLKAATDIPGGVHLVPADGANVDAWAAHIQCHVAYAGSVGAAAMKECPLFMRGARAQRSGDGVDLLLDGKAPAADLAALRTTARAHQ